MRFFSNEANETDETDQTDKTDKTGQDHQTDQAVREHDGANGAASRPVPQQRAGSPWHPDPEPDQQPVAVGTSAVDDDPERTAAFADGAAKADAEAGAAEAKADAHQDDVRKDDAAVDQAFEDRGTFDDPHLTRETDSTVDEPRPATETLLTGPVALFPGGDVESLRERWRDIQLRFVDDPKAATGEAAGLVDEAVDKLAKALRDHRGSLSTGTGETEALRVELRSYRDILDRLLGL
ncbi:hypothetical protein GCM10010112_31660 [Actinoplanes lobatus]|uniref:Uncharacterized protein n=1 Tax=Actinoplanes lobatus TaxID=113568 RepID=A0A7W7HE96_9ACTN|nr:hypothetical protein [Actinoplanes lobatus]MBB4748880.1 hypothetical protein [Actinoplanes lobatus]GGN67859.1 hypothetical protein GCM10010112_31660 [Actinoplanes lobatus]GIE37212.1 hypothetical protein Alo02nite_01100 [Actinoplanes lobatus]